MFKELSTSFILVAFFLQIAVLAQSRSEIVFVEFANKKEPTTLYKGSFALVIGVSDYANWNKLPGVKKDVEAVKSALEKHKFTVEVLEDPKDQDELENGFEQFVKKYGYDKDNRLLIYFAGHGHTGKTADNRDFGYIVPAKAPLPSIDFDGFRKAAVSMNTIEYYADRIEAKHALFIFDSCFSGTLFETRSGEFPVPPFIEEKVERSVRQFITSGAANQTVPDKSIFREFFVRALEGEAANEDGYILGTELANFLIKNVTNYSRRGQTPQYGVIWNTALDKGDFVFVVPNLIEKNKNTALESKAWGLVKDSKNPDDFKPFLTKFPNGQYYDQARRKWEKVWWEERVINNQTLDTFELFIKEFGNDKESLYLATAQNILSNIREELRNPSQVKQGVSQSWGAFVGRVVEAKTFFPIAGATITIRRLQGGILTIAETDSDGQFRQEFLPQGMYEIWFKAKGYNPQMSMQPLYVSTVNTVVPHPRTLEPAG